MDKSSSSQQNARELENNRKSSNRKVLIIAILVIIAAGVGIKFYLDETAENEQLESELNTTIAEFDSISFQLDQKIAKIDSLGGSVDELKLIQRTLEEEKEELRKSNRWAANELKRYRDKVSGYEQLLKNKDEEIEKLKKTNKALLAENTDLKVEKNLLSDSLSEVNNTRSELADKVAMASRLKAENIVVTAVNKRGREREDEFKPRHIEYLRVDFNLAENNVAPTEGKDIYLRIINSNGNALFDVTTGSGSFMIDGKEMFYTAKQEILFDNTMQKLSFNYETEDEYTEGVYQVELYADDYLIGKSEFLIK